MKFYPRNLNFVLVILTLILSGCSSHIPVEDLRELLLEYDRGIIAGVEIGDNWDKVQKGVKRGFAVRKIDSMDGYHRQFSHIWGMNGSGGWLEVNFRLDEENEVSAIKMLFGFAESNRPSATTLQTDLTTHLDSLFGSTEQINVWNLEEVGDSYKAKLTTKKQTNNIKEILKLEIDDSSELSDF